MTELVWGTDLSIFLRGIGVSFLSSAAVPVLYVRVTDPPGVLIQVLLLRIAGIRFIPPYNIKIHVHIKITNDPHKIIDHEQSGIRRKVSAVKIHFKAAIAFKRDGV
jgi:hypothetical protein